MPESTLDGASADVQSRRHVDAFWALLATFVGMLPFLRVVARGQALISEDLGVIHVPLRTLLYQGHATGSMPVWNDAMAGGMPFAADPHAAVWYPVARLLLWIAPDPVAHITWSVVLHGGLMALGAFLWLRQHASAPAAFGGAAVFALNGFMMVHHVHPGIFGAFAWFGWLAWSLDRAVEDQRFFLMASAFGALALLAGNPQAALLVGLAAAGLVLSRAASLWNTNATVTAAWLVGATVAGMLALGASAVAYLPAFEMLGQSFRHLPGAMGEQVASWRYALRLVHPFADGRPDEYTGPANFIESTFFVGGATLVIASAGWASGRTKGLRESLAVCVVGLWLTFGVWGALALLPSSMRAHERAFFLVCAALAYAVASTLDALSTRWTRRSAVGVVVVALCAAALRWVAAPEGLGAVDVGWMILWVTVAAAIAWSVARPTNGRLVMPLVVMGMTAELLVFAFGHVQGLPPEAASRIGADVQEALRPGEHLVAVGRRAEPLGNVAAQLGVSGARAYHPLAPARAVHLLAAVNPTTMNAPHLLLWDDADPRLMELHGATAALDVANDGMQLRLRPSVENVWLTAACTHVPDVTSAVAHALSAPPSARPVALENTDIPCREEGGVMATVQADRCGVDCYTLTIPNAPVRLAVFPIMPYPGWRATIDGADVPVSPADGVRLAVPAISGSTLTLRYEPASLAVGKMITAGSLLVWGGLLAFFWRRRQPCSGRR